MSDFLALAVVMLLVCVAVYCQAPRGYQTKSGFAAILGFVPVIALVAILALSQPWLLIPVVFLLGIGCARR